jgi:G3E family GTPase
MLSNRSGRRIAVLVNDFGAINIDAKLIVSVEGDTISLANGCVCCTIRDDLLNGVIRLLGRDPLPDHIVIETSGVARPVAIAETFLMPATQGLVDVHNMISILDADLTVDPNAGYGDLAFDQIKVADISLAARYAIPAIYFLRVFAQAGGLISFFKIG